MRYTDCFMYFPVSGSTCLYTLVLRCRSGAAQVPLGPVGLVAMWLIKISTKHVVYIIIWSWIAVCFNFSFSNSLKLTKKLAKIVLILQYTICQDLPIFTFCHICFTTIPCSFSLSLSLPMCVQVCIFCNFWSHLRIVYIHYTPLPLKYFVCIF